MDGEGFCFGMALLVVPLLISIIALVIAIKTSNKVDSLASELRRTSHAPPAAAAEIKWPTAQRPTVAEPPRPAPAPPVEVVRPEPEPELVIIEPEPPPPTTPAPAPRVQPVQPARPAPVVDRAYPAAPAAGSTTVGVTPAGPTPKKPIRWEEVIGLKGLAWVGIIAVLFAVAYFAVYAYQQGWFGHIPWMRVLIPGLLGLAILVAGEIFSRKGWRPLARISTGGGLAALYFSVFSGWALGTVQVIPGTATWPLMAVITALAIALSVHYSSLTIAIFSLVGGLAAPMLIRDAEDPGHALFLYVIAVNVGVLVMAYFKKWRVLNLLALAGTILNLTIWLYTFYWHIGSPADKLGMIVAYLTVLWAVFFVLMVVYHLLGRRESSRLDLPVSILNVAWYFSILYQVLYHDYHPYIGPIAAGLGLVYLAQALAMRRWAPQEERLRLLQTGQALALLTLAVPIHLDGIYIPMAWSVWATLLFWLGLRFQDQRLRVIGLLVHMAGLVALGRYAGEMWDTAGMLVLNGRTLTLALVAGGLAFSAFLYRRSSVQNAAENAVMTVATGLAHLLGMTLLAVEVQKWYTEASSVEGLAADALRGLRSTRDACLVVGFSLYGLMGVSLVTVLRRAFHHSMAMVAFAAAFALLAYAHAAGRLPRLEGTPGWNSVGATFAGLVACLALAAVLARYAMRDLLWSRQFFFAYELLAIAATLGLYLTEVSRETIRYARLGDPLVETTVPSLCAAGVAVYFGGLTARAAWIRSVPHLICAVLGLVAAALLVMAASLAHTNAYDTALGNPRGIAFLILAATLAGAAAVARYAPGAAAWREGLVPFELLAWAAVMGLYLTELVQYRTNLAHTPSPMSLTTLLALAAAGFGVYIAGFVGRSVWLRSNAHFVCAAWSLIIAFVLLMVVSVIVPQAYDTPLANARGIAILVTTASLIGAILLARRAKEGVVANRNTSITFELVAWALVLGLYLTETWQLSEHAHAQHRPWADGTLAYLVAAGLAAYVGLLTWRGFGVRSPAHCAAALVCLVSAIGAVLYVPATGGTTYSLILLQPRGAAYLILLASLGWSIVLYGRNAAVGSLDAKQVAGVLTVLCHAAALMLFTLEVNDLWTVHGDTWLTDPEHGWYARHATLSVGYALYAVALLAAGMMRRRALLRVLALIVLAGTIVKVFFYDLRHIEAIWRVLSVFGLGLLLMAGSLLYHKYREVLFKPVEEAQDGGKPQ